MEELHCYLLNKNPWRNCTDLWLLPKEAMERTAGIWFVGSLVYGRSHGKQICGLLPSKPWMLSILRFPRTAEIRDQNLSSERSNPEEMPEDKPIFQTLDR
jgi:hypothetical protein